MSALTTAVVGMYGGCGGGDGGSGGTEGAGIGATLDPGDSTAPEATESGSAVPGEEDEGTLATGVRIARVEVNQGSAIAVAEAGALVPPTDHTALVPGRPGLVRVYWEVDPDWIPRTVEARLLLVDASGERTLHREQRLVDGPPDAQTRDGTFTWELDADALSAGMEFSVGLFEVDAAASAGLVSDDPPRVPVEGQAELGVADVPMRMRVMLVPVTPPGDPGLTITEDERLELERRLFERFPVATAEVIVREPMAYPSTIGDLTEVLDPLIEQRVADVQGGLEGAGWDVYYHAVLNLPGCCSAGVSGGYGLTDVGGGMGETRVSVSAASPGELVGDGWLIAHEIGHNHGIMHAPCGVSDFDPEYPHPDALLGSQGYNVGTGEVLDASSTHDFMSYCSPSGASDYQWERTTRRAIALGSWARQGAAGPSPDDPDWRPSNPAPAGVRCERPDASLAPNRGSR